MINSYGVDCSHWTLVHPQATIDMLGYLPSFVRVDDPRPAKAQFNERYVYGGWRSFEGFQAWAGGLKYPGDPVMHRIAERMLREERIVLHESAWVAIFQPDGSFEVSRLD